MRRYRTIKLEPDRTTHVPNLRPDPQCVRYAFPRICLESAQTEISQSASLLLLTPVTMPVDADNLRLRGLAVRYGSTGDRMRCSAPHLPIKVQLSTTIIIVDVRLGYGTARVLEIMIRGPDPTWPVAGANEPRARLFMPSMTELLGTLDDIHAIPGPLLLFETTSSSPVRPE
ncbi:hypothetical protein RhiXN_08429 [Rhizoctonia solani]|uniref:Uncharacterized protein n=1 Tax=Rhizoctonia solani TaxID=456999 RepID=A0A8H8P3Z7_9AGAM|nr:uncharacterized protein RhiXN_08429 [Rhizoctonia solani]QRW23393.1 hypothetical protein RhiXN_08429 [Rhizoctonia solani]